MSVSVMVVVPECVAAATSAKAGLAEAPVVSVQCEASVPYNIGLSEGLSETTVGSRTYSLKSSTGETARWGQRIGVTSSEPATNKFSLVGPTPVKEEVGDGRAPDTITVTITY